MMFMKWVLGGIFSLGFADQWTKDLGNELQLVTEMT